MGAVYRAEGVRLGRKVALKLLAPGTYTTFPVCEGPSGIALGEGAVWVACGDGTVARLDPRTELVDMIELGQPPSGIVADFGQVRTSPGEPVE
jgi:streptogramin lyase